MTMWNNVILCLGSNTDCEANLKSAVSLLRAYFGSIRFSEYGADRFIRFRLILEPSGCCRYECFAGRGEAGCEGDGKTIGTHVGQ